jgi:hypothetical protein
MNVQLLRDELQHVLSGKSSVRFGRTIQSISRHLGNGQGTSEAIEDQKLFKKQEEERLIEFIRTNNLWLNDIDFSQYVSEFITRHSPLAIPPLYLPQTTPFHRCALCAEESPGCSGHRTL